MDGTLIDSSEVICNAINYVRRHLGLDAMEHESILRGINDLSIHAPSYFYGIDAYREEHILWFQEYYTKYHQKETRCYPGIARLLQKLTDASKTLTIATNAYRRSAEQILFANKIDRYFDLLVCADEVEQGKPDPEMIELIMAYYALPAEAFLLIGDSPKDLEAARRAGIDAISVNWGFSEIDEAIRSTASLEKLLLQ